VQDVDENAPEAWKRMYSNSSPDEVFVSLKGNEQEDITRWNDQRSKVIQQRLQDEVQAELETQSSLSLHRKSAPFLRVKVHSVNPRQGRCESGLLTIWNPNEEQLNLLKEGSFVQIYNLTVRDLLHDGHLQLTANNRTLVEGYSFDSPLFTGKIGYVARRYLSMIDVHMLCHHSATGGEKTIQSDEFDTVVACANMTMTSNGKQEFLIYVTDESYLILRIGAVYLGFGTFACVISTLVTNVQ
jgi:hypothetical protein